MKKRELYEAMEAWIPKSLSCPWDNDGLMVTSELESEVHRVLVALDATEAAIRYAASHGYDVLVTHHPMIFRGAKSISPDTLEGRRVIAALSGGVMVLSYHTRLDAMAGGVNDALCTALGWTADSSFGDAESPSLGRLATLSEGMTVSALAAWVKEHLGAPFVRVTSAADRETVVHRVALCCGDGKDFTYPALHAGAEVLITGASGYNMAEDAAECGLTTIEAGHYTTEVPVCTVLMNKLTEWGLSCSFYNSCMERISR